MPLLPCLDLVLVLKKEVDVIERIHQAVFLITIDLETLLTSCGEIGHCLVGHIHPHLHLGVGLDAGKQLSEEILTDYHWKHEIVEFVVLVDICKEAGDDYPESVAGDGPSRMLT